MTPKATVVAICKATGLPFAAERWPAGYAVSYPSLVYDYEGKDNLYADGRVYASVENWSITLYSERRDERAEAAVEAAIEDAGLVPGEPMCGYDDENRRRWCMWAFCLPASA